MNTYFAQILAQRDNFEAILNSISEGILTVDGTLGITTFNRSAERITGISRAEAIGTRCTDFFHKILEGQECPICKALMREEYMEEIEYEILRRDGQSRVVLVTTNPLLDSANRRTGAVVILHDIQELRDLSEKLKARYRFHNIIGKNHKMQEIYKLIEQVAESTASVLIQGESGTGKELVAHAIHYQSRRANGPFVTVNCSALAETLLESELFGHVKGAFTGATYNKVGRFELADGGTIFLDEIGEISPIVQLKLLRVLQEKEFEKVGESRSRRVNVRIIAATNKDLKGQVQKGRFRDDLYYRLKVVPIHIPPLRERKDDIPLLVDYFIQKYNHQMGKRILGGTKKAMATLLDYEWPGNVRELENAIEHAFVLCQGSRFGLLDLPAEIRKDRVEPIIESQRGALHSPAQEKEIIFQALKDANWNKTRTARALGISRVSLWRKSKLYGFSPGDLKLT